MYKTSVAVLLLGLAILIGVAMAAPTSSVYLSQAITDTLPSTMVNQSVQSIDLSFKNTGSESWNTTTCYLLGFEDARNFSATKYLLTTNLSTNGMANFTFNLTAPNETGTYTVRYAIRASGVKTIYEIVEQRIVVT